MGKVTETDTLTRGKRFDIWIDRDGRPWKWFGGYLRGQWKFGQHYIDPDDLFGCGYWVWGIPRVGPIGLNGGEIEREPKQHGPFHIGRPEECLGFRHRAGCSNAPKTTVHVIN